MRLILRVTPNRRARAPPEVLGDDRIATFFGLNRLTRGVYADPCQRPVRLSAHRYIKSAAPCEVFYKKCGYDFIPFKPSYNVAYKLRV